MGIGSFRLIQERLKEIKEWSRQCLAFRRELRNLEGGVAEVESLKREILQLQKELLQGAPLARKDCRCCARPVAVLCPKRSLNMHVFFMPALELPKFGR